MFNIHISPSLQLDFGIIDKDRAVLTLNSIIEKCGKNSGLTIVIRRNLPSYIRGNVILTIERVDVEEYLGWFKVVKISQVRVYNLLFPLSFTSFV